jgi:hypothetical protein
MVSPKKVKLPVSSKVMPAVSTPLRSQTASTPTAKKPPSEMEVPTNDSIHIIPLPALEAVAEEEEDIDMEDAEIEPVEQTNVDSNAATATCSTEANIPIEAFPVEEPISSPKIQEIEIAVPVTATVTVPVVAAKVITVTNDNAFSTDKSDANDEIRVHAKHSKALLAYKRGLLKPKPTAFAKLHARGKRRVSAQEALKAKAKAKAKAKVEASKQRSQAVKSVVEPIANPTTEQIAELVVGPIEHSTAEATIDVSASEQISKPETIAPVLTDSEPKISETSETPVTLEATSTPVQSVATHANATATPVKATATPAKISSTPAKKTPAKQATSQAKVSISVKSNATPAKTPVKAAPTPLKAIMTPISTPVKPFTVAETLFEVAVTEPIAILDSKELQVINEPSESTSAIAAQEFVSEELSEPLGQQQKEEIVDSNLLELSDESIKMDSIVPVVAPELEPIENTVLALSATESISAESESVPDSVPTMAEDENNTKEDFPESIVEPSKLISSEEVSAVEPEPISEPAAEATTEMIPEPIASIVNETVETAITIDSAEPKSEIEEPQPTKSRRRTIVENSAPVDTRTRSTRRATIAPAAIAVVETVEVPVRSTRRRQTIAPTPAADVNIAVVSEVESDSESRLNTRTTRRRQTVATNISIEDLSKPTTTKRSKRSKLEDESAAVSVKAKEDEKVEETDNSAPKRSTRRRKVEPSEIEIDSTTEAPKPRSTRTTRAAESVVVEDAEVAEVTAAIQIETEVAPKARPTRGRKTEVIEPSIPVEEKLAPASSSTRATRTTRKVTAEPTIEPTAELTVEPVTTARSRRTRKVDEISTEATVTPAATETNVRSTRTRKAETKEDEQKDVEPKTTTRTTRKRAEPEPEPIAAEPVAPTRYLRSRK